MENEEILINDTEPTEAPTPEPFEIPYVYNYSTETKEYIGKQQADKNPAESIAKGKFIPLVPANATLLEPPTVEENQIQVYSKEIETHEEPYEVIDEETGESHTEYKTITEVIEKWDIEPDYRKNFVKVDEAFNVFEIDTIGEQTGFFVVTKEVGAEIEENPDMFKIVDNEIVKKSKKEYDKEQEEKREQAFKQAFFITSLGYVRRSVTMADGTKKDFLSDLLPVISMGVQSGTEVHILTYEEPPFDEDITDWTEYQKQVTVTPQFIQECFLQLSNDFLPINEE